MSNPTSNFGWQMPTNTDLVTNLPADFEVFGQAVDSDFADLKGGTTGQILSKNSNTDLDFVWIANDQGDITGVTATSPLTGGGTSGAITVGIQAASTTQSGSVQLTDSTSSTSTTTAATPNSVKTAYDLANAAIPLSTTTTAGDLLYRNGSTVTRLPIGTAGQVLKVNTGATAPEWGTASGGGKVLQVVYASNDTSVTIASTTWTDGGVSATITPSSTTSRIMVISTVMFRVASQSQTYAGGGVRLLRGSTTVFDQTAGDGFQSLFMGYPSNTDAQSPVPITYVDSPASTSALTYKTQARAYTTAGSSVAYTNIDNAVSTMILMEIGA